MAQQPSDHSIPPTRRVFRWSWFLGLIVLVVSGMSGLWYAHQSQLPRVALALEEKADEWASNGDHKQEAKYLYRALQITTDRAKRAGLLTRLARAYDRGLALGDDPATAIKWYYQATAESPDDIGLVHRLAELFLETEQFVLAEEQTRLILRREAQHLGALRVQALARYGQLRRGRPIPVERVLRDLEDTHRRSPNDVVVAEAFVDILRTHSPDTSESQANARQANAVMDALVQNAPQDPAAYLARHRYRSRFEGRADDSDLQRARELAPQDPRVLLATAELAQQNGRLEEAVARYRDLIGVRPTDVLGPLGLGNVLHQLGRTDEALATWRQGLVSAPRGQLPLRVRLIDVLIERREFPAAEAELALLDQSIRHLATSGRESQRDWVVAARDLLQAKWLAAQARYADAIPLLERVAATATADRSQVAENTPTYQAWLLLGECFLRQQQWEDAATSFQRALQVVPHSHVARLAAAKAWSIVGRDEQALLLCEQVVARPQAPAEAWRLLAQLHLRMQLRRPPHLRHWEALEAVLQQAATALPDDWELPLVHVNLLLARDGVAGAGRAFELLLAEETRHPDSLPLWSNLVFLYERMGLPQEADRALARLQELRPHDAQVTAWQAALEATRGHYDVAERAIATAREQKTPDEQQWLDRAHLLIAHHQGDLAKTRQILDTLLASRPQSTEVLAQLADLALLEADADTLTQRVRQLKEAEGPDGVWWRFFEVRRLLLQNPGQAEAQAQAATLYEETRRLRSWWPGCELLRALLADQQGRAVEAIEAYASSIEAGFQQPGLYQRLIQLLHQQGRFTEAEGWLQQIQRIAPLDSRMFDLAWGSAMEQNRVEFAIRLARDNVAQHPQDGAAEVWLAQILWLAGEHDEAAQHAARAEEFATSDATIWTGLLTYYLRSSDQQGADRALQRLLSHPQVLPLQRHLIAAQAQQQLGRRDDAQQAYLEAIQMAPEDADLRVQFGLFLQPFDPDRAEEELREAIRLQPEHDTARRTLATWLSWRSDASAEQEAQKLLHRSDSLASPLAADQRLEAILLLRRGMPADRQAAREILERLTAQPQYAEAEDFWLLAQLLEQSQDASAADATYQRLLERTPVQARHRAAYVDFLLRNRRFVDAEEPLRELERQAPGTMSAVSLRSRWLLAAGRAAEIDTYLDQYATQQLNGMSEPSQRMGFLQQIAELYLMVERNDAAERWFQRLVQEFPAQRESLTRYWLSRQKHQEALNFAFRDLQQQATPQAAALLARVLLYCPAEMVTSDGANAAQVEHLLDEMLVKHPEDADLLFSMSNLRLKQQRIPEAIGLLRQLTQKHNRHVTAWNNLAALLSDDETQLDAALECIDQAISAAGQPIANLLDTKAVILLRQNQPLEAARFLNQAVTLPDAVDPRFYLHLAIALQQLQQPDRASQMWEQAQALGLKDAFLTTQDQIWMDSLVDSLSASREEGANDAS